MAEQERKLHTTRRWHYGRLSPRAARMLCSHALHPPATNRELAIHLSLPPPQAFMNFDGQIYGPAIYQFQQVRKTDGALVRSMWGRERSTGAEPAVLHVMHLAMGCHGVQGSLAPQGVP